MSSSSSSSSSFSSSSSDGPASTGRTAASRFGLEPDPAERARFGSRQIAPESLAVPAPRRMLQRWHAHCRPGRLPSRDHFRPEDMRIALGFVNLYGVESPPMRFRLHMQGSEAALASARDLTGVWLDEIQPPAFGQMLHRQFIDLVERRQPRVDLILFDDTIRLYAYSRLGLPLASDGETVDWVLGIVTPFEQDELDEMGGLPELDREDLG